MNKVLFTSNTVTSGTYTSNPITTAGYTGARFFLDITAATSITSLVVSIEAYDKAGNKWLALPGGAFAALSAVTSKTLSIYPGVTETTNESVSDVIADTIRASAVLTCTGTNVCTFTLGADLLH